MSATKENNSVYDLGTSTVDKIIVVNSGPEKIRFYVLIYNDPSTDTPNPNPLDTYLKQAQLNFEWILETNPDFKNSNSFSDARGRDERPFYSSNFDPFNGSRSRTPDSKMGGESLCSYTPLSTVTTLQIQPLTQIEPLLQMEADGEPYRVLHAFFNMELICATLLASYYPALAINGIRTAAAAINDMECSVIGPTDSGLEFLAVLSVAFTHPRAGVQSLSQTLLLCPLSGGFIVLRICDLSKVCTSTLAPDFNRYFDQSQAVARDQGAGLGLAWQRGYGDGIGGYGDGASGEEITWLSVAHQFYCTCSVTRHYARLFPAEFCSSSYSAQARAQQVGSSSSPPHPWGSYNPNPSASYDLLVCRYPRLVFTWPYQAAPSLDHHPWVGKNGNGGTVATGTISNSHAHPASRGGEREGGTDAHIASGYSKPRQGHGETARGGGRSRAAFQLMTNANIVFHGKSLPAMTHYFWPVQLTTD